MHKFTVYFSLALLCNLFFSFEAIANFDTLSVLKLQDSVLRNHHNYLPKSAIINTYCREIPKVDFIDKYGIRNSYDVVYDSTLIYIRTQVTYSIGILKTNKISGILALDRSTGKLRSIHFKQYDYRFLRALWSNLVFYPHHLNYPKLQNLLELSGEMKIINIDTTFNTGTYNDEMLKTEKVYFSIGTGILSGSNLQNRNGPFNPIEDLNREPHYKPVLTFKSAFFQVKDINGDINPYYYRQRELMIDLNRLIIILDGIKATPSGAIICPHL